MNIKHDRENVLRIGIQLFCEKGYEHLGVDEICLRTGMTKGAFYNAFKSKEGFLTSAILTYSEKNVIRIEKELAPREGKTAISRLNDFYENMLAVQPKIDHIGCMINTIMSELGFKNQLVSELTTAQFEAFIDAIEPTVKEAQLNGELTTQFNSRELTELMHSTFYGVLTRSKGASDMTKSIETMRLLFHNLK